MTGRAIDSGHDEGSEDTGSAAETGSGLSFDGASRTRVGQVRAHNEDNCVVTTSLVAVADGMGGHAAGEVASAIAVDALAAGTHDLTIESIVELVGDANSQILMAATDDPAKRGMGTTLCIAAVVQSHGRDMLALANVGDSRIYALTDGTLHQLSEDHSLVESLVREGRITPEEAATHPQRNVLTRALGVDRDVLVDVWLLDPRPGDRFLLCSDGLFNEVDHDRIEKVLEESGSPADAAETLAESADEAGGRDNITVVVADLIGAHGSPEPLGSRLRWIGTSTNTSYTGTPASDDTASVPVVTPIAPLADAATIQVPEGARSDSPTDKVVDDADDHTDDNDTTDGPVDANLDGDTNTAVHQRAAGGDQMTIHDAADTGTVDRGTIDPDGTGDQDPGATGADPGDQDAETADGPRDPDDTDADPLPGSADDQLDDGGQNGGPPWRIIAFLVTIVLIIAIGVGALIVHERQGWTVRSRDNEVILFRGRSESPPVIGSSELVVIDGVTVDELTEAVQRKLELGERFETRSKAEAYAEGLRDSTVPTTTTTTSTTTTTPTTSTTTTTAPTSLPEDEQATVTTPDAAAQTPPSPPISGP